MPLSISILHLIIITLPIGTKIQLGSEYLTLTYFLIYIYILLKIKNFKIIFEKKYNKYIFPFLLIITIMFFSEYYSDFKTGELGFSIIRQILFMLLFFCCAIKDFVIMKTSNRPLDCSLLYSSILISIIYYTGLFPSVDDDGRVSTFDLNSNLLAGYCILGIIYSMNYLANKDFYIFKINSLFLLVFQFSAVLIILNTGSRGGVLTIFVFFIMYILLDKSKSRYKSLLKGLVLFVFLFLLFFLMNSKLLTERFNEIGDDIRVTYLWPIAISLIERYPLFGSSLSGFESTVIPIFGRMFSPHNEFLKVLLMSGFVGLGLFVYFLILLLKCAYNYYRITKNPFYIYIFVFLMLSINQGYPLQLPLIWILFLTFLSLLGGFNYEVRRT